MEVEEESKLLKCFVCQSKSQSADDESEKRRRPSQNHNSLDPSTWKIFCHYFYPPPLTGLFGSPSTEHEYKNEDHEDHSLPVFCDVCCQTILKLCDLHSQLESIQGQISKTVSRVALTFVQEEVKDENEENNGHNNNYDHLSSSSGQQKQKNMDEKHQNCDDNVIYSMRRCIRQRYLPSVCITRSNFDIPNQNGGGGFNDLQIGPLPWLSNDLNPYLNFDLDPSLAVKKEEVEDSMNMMGAYNEELENLEYLNCDVSINENPFFLPAEGVECGINLDENMIRLANMDTIINYSDDEDDSNSDSDSNQGSDSESDCDDNNDKKLAVLKRSALLEPNSKPTRKFQILHKVVLMDKPSDDRIKAKPKCRNKRRMARPTKDPKFGEDIYLHMGKWRYERKVNGGGRPRWQCLTCPKAFARRGQLLRHIEKIHCAVPALRGRVRTLKVDENHFTFDDIYSFSRVTEATGSFYKCGVANCGSLKKTLTQMKTHLRQVHADGKKYVCEQCGYRCSDNARLQNHIATHTAVKKFICEQCGKAFKTTNELKHHKESHISGGKSFICDCGKKFRYSKNLHRHRSWSNHPAPKKEEPAPFSHKNCPSCKKEFVSDEKFQKHVSSCQVRVKKRCEWCGGLFFQLQAHMKNGCKERFKMQESGAGENTNTNINVDSVTYGAANDNDVEKKM